jgi:hypothetical protein
VVPRAAAVYDRQLKNERKLHTVLHHMISCSVDDK